MDKRDGIWYDEYVGPLLGAALILSIAPYIPLTGRKGVRGKPRKGVLRLFNQEFSELF